MEILTELVGATVVSSGVADYPYLVFSGDSALDQQQLWIDSGVSLDRAGDEPSKAAPGGDGSDLSSLVGLKVETATIHGESGLQVDFVSGARLLVESRSVSPPWWVSKGRASH